MNQDRNPSALYQRTDTEGRPGTLSIDVQDVDKRMGKIDKHFSQASASMSTSANFGRSMKQVRNDLSSIYQRNKAVSLVISQDGLQTQ